MTILKGLEGLQILRYLVDHIYDNYRVDILIRPLKIPGIILAIFLFLALLKMPYGYYQLLRIIITIGAVCFAYQVREHELKWVMWSFIGIAILFNPIAPVHLQREIWRYVDVIVGVGFIVAGYFITPSKPPVTVDK